MCHQNRSFYFDVIYETIPYNRPNDIDIDTGSSIFFLF